MVEVDLSQRDHAAIVPQLGEGPATESVRHGSNICHAQGKRSTFMEYRRTKFHLATS